MASNPKLLELLAQKAELEKMIEALQRDSRLAAIAEARALIAEYGLTAADVLGGAAPQRGAAQAGRKVAAKYRDAATGNTWTGRGRTPRWLAQMLAGGHTLAEFDISARST